MIETVYRKYLVMTIAREVFFDAIKSFLLDLQLVKCSCWILWSEVGILSEEQVPNKKRQSVLIL
jgi:hypothetical protein